MSLVIEGELTIYTALAITQRVVAEMRTQQDIEVDLSGVEEMDTAGAQILIAAKREAAASGKQFRITSHSGHVREVLDFLGLTSEFGDPVLIPSKAT